MHGYRIAKGIFLTSGRGSHEGQKKLPPPSFTGTFPSDPRPKWCASVTNVLSFESVNRLKECIGEVVARRALKTLTRIQISRGILNKVSLISYIPFQQGGSW